jgi:glycosyltransferase involved in cell wall biosynthesis
LVVPERDSHALAQAIITLASDTDRAARLGELAAREIRSDYDMDRTSQRLEELYRSILDATAGAGH